MSVFPQLVATANLALLRTWQRWYLVVGSLVICVLGVIGWAQISAPQYVTTMTVTAPTNNGAGSGGGAAAALGAASALGLSLGGGGSSSQFESYLTLLQSTTVAETLLKDRHIVALLFGAALDPETGKWRDSNTRQLKNQVFELFGVTRSDGPSVDDVQVTLNTMLAINVTSALRTMATVSCTSSQPPMCREILLAVDHAAQARLDAIAIENAHHMATYLENFLATVNEVTLRQALTSVMATTEVQAVMNGANEQQRAVVLGLPVTPTRPAFPRPAILLELAILAGLVLGGTLAWFAGEISQRRASTRLARETA